MSLLQELEALIARTGSYNDRALLTEILEEMKKTHTPKWGYYEEKRVIRR